MPEPEQIANLGTSIQIDILALDKFYEANDGQTK